MEFDRKFPFQVNAVDGRTFNGCPSHLYYSTVRHVPFVLNGDGVPPSIDVQLYIALGYELERNHWQRQ